MKLIVSGLGCSVDINPGDISTLKISNSALFQSVVDKIFLSSIGESKEAFIVDDDGGHLDLDKVADIVFSPRLIDFKSKKIVTAITGKIKRHISVDIELKNKFEASTLDLISQLEEIMEELELPLRFDSNVDIVSLLKLVNVSAEYDDSSQLSLMKSYLDICSEFNINRFIFVINFQSLFDITQIDELESFALKRQISLIFIDQINSAISSSEKEEVTFIDQDFNVSKKNASYDASYEYVFD